MGDKMTDFSQFNNFIVYVEIIPDSDGHTFYPNILYSSDKNQDINHDDLQQICFKNNQNQGFYSFSSDGKGSFIGEYIDSVILYFPNNKKSKEVLDQFVRVNSYTNYRIENEGAKLLTWKFKSTDKFQDGFFDDLKPKIFPSSNKLSEIVFETPLSLVPDVLGTNHYMDDKRRFVYNIVSNWLKSPNKLLNIMLDGNAGTGKTSFVYSLVEHLAIEQNLDFNFIYVSPSAIIDGSELFYNKNLVVDEDSGSTITINEETELTEKLFDDSKPLIVFINEFNRSSNMMVSATLIELIGEEKVIYLGKDKVHYPANTMFILAQNSGDEYTDIRETDRALNSRFHICVKMDVFDKTKVLSIIKGMYGDVYDNNTLSKIYDIYERIDSILSNHYDEEQVLTIRELIALITAYYYSGNSNIQKCIKTTFLNKFDDLPNDVLIRIQSGTNIEGL